MTRRARGVRCFGALASEAYASTQSPAEVALERQATAFAPSASLDHRPAMLPVARARSAIGQP
jgi:hypothetical protein